MVITMSREAEAGAEEIARLVAEQCGLQVADRVILERIAQQEGMPVRLVGLFDDTVPGAIEALIAEWQTSVSQASYLRRLVRILLVLEQEDSVIILGRGAAFVLTDPGTLHVRVIAPLPCRIARLVQRQGLRPAEAERLLVRSDLDRQRFVRQAFGADVASPSHYDLTLNTAELSPQTAAELVILAARRKSARRQVAAEGPEYLLTHLTRVQRRSQLPRVSSVTWESVWRRSTLP